MKSAFDQYQSELERIRVKTAHDEHIIEFNQMCAAMIETRVPEIVREELSRLGVGQSTDFGLQPTIDGEPVNSKNLGEQIRKTIIKTLNRIRW